LSNFAGGGGGGAEDDELFLEVGCWAKFSKLSGMLSMKRSEIHTTRAVFEPENGYGMLLTIN